MVSQRQWIRQQMLPEGPTGCKQFNWFCQNSELSGEIELLGGPTELGGAIVEGNVYIDGNPVSLSTFNCFFLQHSFTIEIPLCADL